MMLLQTCLTGVILARFALAAPGTRCTSLTLDYPPPGTTLLNITAVERHNITITGTRFNNTGTVSGISFCDVQLYLTHSGSDSDDNDQVRIALWLPLPIHKNSWNNRFLGTGGAGFNAGVFDPALAEGVEAGFATASTDAGVGLSGDPRFWASSERLVDNFVHRSVHEMTLVGKALTERYYGREIGYSYFHGCSQGGRQGYVEALRYPGDYDGISAHSPGINWERILVGFLWPYLRGYLETRVSGCKLEALMKGAVEVCDGLDGAVDGMIGYPPECGFDALSMVGVEVSGCAQSDDGNVITREEAEAWNSIRSGPTDESGNSLWYGMEPGSDLSFVTLAPFPPAESWLQDFVLREPDFDMSTLTYEKYLEAFNLSVATFQDTWGSPNADLSRFQHGGGKLLTFHGWADQSIPGNGTIEYWRRVQESSQASSNISLPNEGMDSFFRLFMAPGVGHCANFGYGPGPVNLLGSLVAWVEEGKAPDTLFAAGFGQTRDLCRYPMRTRYTGKGDVKDAGSWACI